MKSRTLRRARAAAARGVTLVEILIVLAIVGLIAGGVAMVAVPRFLEAQKKSTHTNAIAIYTAAESWRAAHPTECPTAERLKAEGVVSPTSKITDAWDMPYKITCDGDSFTVTSFGPDKRESTPDDIKIPDTAPPERHARTD